MALDLEQVKKDPALSYCLDMFLDYSSHAIQEKSIPSLIDGLLPTQRRYIFSFQDLKAFHDKKSVKSTLVGSHVTGYYSPQGNAYGVLVNMSQVFKVQLPLTIPEGNWGEIENGIPAAERYTESRLSRFAQELLLEDLPAIRVTADDKPHNIVPCSLNYLSTHWEEDYLPARLPLLMINGSSGIAVGLSQTFQPLEFRSFLIELKRYIEESHIIYENLRLGHPTKCSVISTQEEFIEALQRGHGIIRLAASNSILKDKNKITGVVIDSVPPYTMLNDVGDAFNDWRQKDRNCPFSEFRNETNKISIRLVFKYKNPHIPKSIEEHNINVQTLYKKVGLIVSNQVNMTALKNQFPVEYDLESFIKDWIQERTIIIQAVAQKEFYRLMAQKRKLDLVVWVKANFDELSTLLKTETSEDFLYIQMNQIFKKSAIKDDYLDMDDFKYIMSTTLNQIAKVAENELNNRLKIISEKLEYVNLLIEDGGARLKDIVKDIDYFLGAGYLANIDNTCEFDPNLREILIAKITQKEVRKVSNQNLIESYLTPSKKVDIIIQTKKDFFIRLSNNSVKTSPLEINFATSEDEILQASYLTTDNILFITSDGRLFVLDRELIPYNKPIYITKILDFAKFNWNGNTAPIHIVPAIQDNPEFMILHFFKGEFKKVSLKDFGSFRARVKFPSPLIYASLTTDKYPVEFTSDSGLLFLGLPSILPSSLKNIGRLHKITSIGMPISINNNYKLLISKERSGVYKEQYGV